MRVRARLPAQGRSARGALLHERAPLPPLLTTSGEGSSTRPQDRRLPLPDALTIRAMEPADWPAVWRLLEPVFRSGETFPHGPEITEAQAHDLWVGQIPAVMVAVDAAKAVVGTYYLKPNSLTLGAHFANAGYVGAPHCRRQGIGSRLCQHSLQGGPAARLPRHAVQPGGEHQHLRPPLLAGERLPDRRHPARLLPPPAAGLRGCPRPVPEPGGGAGSMRVVPL